MPPGKTRIICSGDSFTLGFGVDNEHTWPQQLAARNANLETVNMGQGGYGADPLVSPVQVGAGERIMDQALIHLYKMRGKLPSLVSQPAPRK